ncbi:hypothetical protein KIH39_23250 [Telmatocola sphagniphila]|uniref:Uncharacterized protein n=1 Tax=Telmatocola sphagniphila TaxID=1123043 RepID=A0A8E6B4R0_9BACT|nr:hypothetical protein [Telmatocola sphagniphila]QVL31726.1 hypothetical protein KIH39_23250 [Telmatocola sphagniphila]
MASILNSSRGNELAHTLFSSFGELDRLPLGGSRNIPNLAGYSRKVGYTNTDNFILLARQLLLESERVFDYGGKMVYLRGEGFGPSAKLCNIFTETGPDRNGPSHLANILVCSDEKGKFLIPREAISLIFCSNLIENSFPEITTSAGRPLFDSQFKILRPGYYPESKILVTGESIEPILRGSTPTTGPILERLPQHLRTLLQNFCFKTDADLANMIAFLITGLLINHFIEDGKPLAVIDGNQPGLGKTLLARLVGQIFDNNNPALLGYLPEEEELQKRLCASLQRDAHVLIIDNARNARQQSVASPVLEANSVSPTIELRILGTSTNMRRSNDILWILTMNQTSLSSDLVSRSLPIRLHYDGDPRSRQFPTDFDPMQFAREHRSEIISELMGMVIHWVQQGRPTGNGRHRFRVWGQVISGIMEANGFHEFLANISEASEEFDSDRTHLMALADSVIRLQGPYLHPDTTAREATGIAKLSKDWLIYFSASEAFENVVGKPQERVQAQLAGAELSRLLGRETPIAIDGRPAKAVLKKLRERGNRNLYYLDCLWESRIETDTGASSLAAGAVLADGNLSSVVEVRSDISTQPVQTEGSTTENQPHSDGSGNTEEW